jgi:hypothetical protein
METNDGHHGIFLRYLPLYSAVVFINGYVMIICLFNAENVCPTLERVLGAYAIKDDDGVLIPAWNIVMQMVCVCCLNY